MNQNSRMVQKEKEVILREAFSMFKNHGIVPIKMDDIANRLSMSKRTLYEMFKNKENLILESIIAHNKRNTILLEVEGDYEHNILKQAFDFLHLVMMEFKSSNYRFYEDLKKYPKVLAYIEQVHSESRVKGKKWLKKGVKQGLFRDDINIELITNTVFYLSQSLSHRKVMNEYSIKTLLSSIYMVILRGIATSKGLSILYIYEKKYFTNEEI